MNAPIYGSIDYSDKVQNRSYEASMLVRNHDVSLVSGMTVQLAKHLKNTLEHICNKETMQQTK